MKFGKKELIASAMVVILGLAVYVNRELSTPETFGNDEDLGTAHYVNASISEKATPDKPTVPEKIAESSKPSEQQEYFARVRLERQKTQDELVSLARSVAESESTSPEAKAQAMKQLDSLINLINQQNSIEGLILSKGFSDCIAYIQNNECSIVVTGKELKSDTLTSIKDIVKSQAGITFDKIRITEI